MRVCQVCDRDYADDTLSFCLMCGANLVDGDVTPTIAVSGEDMSGPTIAMTAAGRFGAPPDEPRSKTNALMIVTVSVFAVGLFALVTFIFVESMIRRGDRVKANQERANSISANTSPVSSPLPYKRPAELPPTGNRPDVMSIKWYTTGKIVVPTPGVNYRFQCPASGRPALVWGDGTYTADSSICSAAVHAGAITVGAGGEVTVEYCPGQEAYQSSTKNGIASRAFGAYSTSFVVKTGDK